MGNGLGSQQTHHHEKNVGASSTGNMANYGNTSVSSLSNQSSSFGSTGGIYTSKEQSQQQKMVPLNDIEFPQLFMY
jgi:hypothetical protein